MTDWIHPDPIARRSVDRSERRGHTAFVLLLAATLASAVAIMFWLGDASRTQFLLWFLAALAALGVLSLFLLAMGGLQVAGRGLRDDLTRHMADHAREGLIVTDADGRVVYANAAYLALAGAGAAALVRPVERLFTGSAAVSEAVYRLAQAAREGRAASEDIRLQPALDGQHEAGWYRVRVQPIARNRGRETLWTVADITRDQERHENAFQDLQTAINYLEHAPAGFFSAEPDGRISYMNATLAGWLDLDIADVGTGGRMTLAQLVSGASASLLDGLPGAPGQVRTEVLDVDLRRRGGQVLPVRLLHRVSYSHDGQPGSSRTLVLNRAQGGEAAADGEAAEVRFARFFHNAPIAIAMVDAEGRMGETNATFLRLFAEAMGPEGKGQTLDRLVTEADRRALRSLIARAAGGSAENPTLDVALALGEGRTARIFAVPGGLAQGDAIVYLLETTDQRRLQEQVAQAQKMNAVGQLAGGIAHDFNNLLQVIIGVADLLLASQRPSDPSFKDIMQIKQNANRASALVRQLLAFSRQQTLRPDVLNLNETIAELEVMLKRLIGQSVQLDVEHGRDLWPVFADAGQIEQVIVNLAVNARDAMPDGGRLTMRTTNLPAQEAVRLGADIPEADHVLIEVRDTGHGMSPEIMAKIFEPFFTTKEVGKGTGLGLATVFGIVAQSGGRILVESAVGQGTTFRILLPRHRPTAAAASPVAEAKRVARDLTGHETILVVEDEDGVRSFASRALRSKGYRVLEATSGSEALDIVERDPDAVSLVLSDVIMPEMDGPTLLSEMRRRGFQHRFIFASGYAEDAFRKNLKEGESFGFLAKPYSLRQLAETVKSEITALSA